MDNEIVQKLRFQNHTNSQLHHLLWKFLFCIIDKLNPLKEEIKEAAIICALKSQDWRDNKKDVVIHMFSGKEVAKDKDMKEGTWKVKSKPKLIKVKKKEIEEWIKKNRKDLI